MSINDPHNEFNEVDEQSKAFFANGEINWSKSKNDAWSELMQKTDEPQIKHILIPPNRLMQYSIAASIALLIGVVAFLRLYTVEIDAPAGVHHHANLPDGSSVFLNAGTEISYNPYWWRFKREVSLSGEAFFEVEKGKKFQVVSELGITEVLGTSFNIYARNTEYVVTCLTGSVKVTSLAKKEVVLKPNTKVEVIKRGKLDVKLNIDSYSVVSWRNNEFVFSGLPIYKVLNEIARQYNINISADIDTMMLYSGNFTKMNNVESVFGYICPALGLTYTKTGENSYRITTGE